MGKGRKTRRGAAAGDAFDRWLPPGPLREAAALLAIWCAGWAAHGGCLHAVWFLDDWSKIVHNPDFSTRTADLGLSGVTELTYRLLGGTGFACHLGNLLIHLLLASLVWWLGPLFFRYAPRIVPAVEPRLAAFLGALVFAVHPLCSEVTHYARARDHELVGLFSFLTAVAALLWLKRGWRWAPVLLAVAGLDVLSKGPGPAHAALATGAVCLFFAERGELRRRLASRWTVYAFLIGPLLLVDLFPAEVLGWGGRIAGSWGDLWWWHTLTQARVFWEYIARMAWPAGLCPDHLVAFTRSAGDVPAWLALAGVAAALAGIALLARSGRRLLAFLLFMVAANLLLRWFYILSELMVEYRTYPSMPWLGLLAGAGLAWVFARKRAAAIGALAIVLVAGIVLTWARSAVWASSDTLAASILEQYPWQLRAYMERTYVDYVRHDVGDATAALDEFYPKLRDVLAWNGANPDRVYPNWPLWAVSVEGNVADCLIQAGRLGEAETLLERTQRNMTRNGETDEVLWDSWYFERAKIENRRGDFGHARLDLLRMGGWFFDPGEYAAERRRAGMEEAPGTPAPGSR